LFAGLIPKPPNFMQGADREASEAVTEQEEEQAAAMAM
jgi:hypothetical protein